ncbi:MAG: ribosome small subunit-dependent GTPase A, partial [Fibrobacter sp.]|nr:ribosome small subunit-dependent GTPase A [Fibrobacter sp.]
GSDFEKLDSICTLYNQIGYQTIKSSATEGTGIKQITELCKDQISAFAGLSGVGKSSILSKIFPDKQLRIGKVSGTTGRGTHTTTYTSLHRLSDGGYIVDTPGLSFVEIPRVPEEDVISYFPELLKNVGLCRFNNCIHNGEPGCIISEMVLQKQIADTRHYHYLKIYQEMKQLRKQYH